MRTEDTHEKFVKDLQDIHVLKMTGCFLAISEAVVSKRLKNDIYRKFLGKTLLLSEKLYHQHDWYKTQRRVTTNKPFFVIPLFNKKPHKNYLPCWFEKQPFSRVFKHFLKFFTVSPRGTFSINDNMFQNIVVAEIRNFYKRKLLRH